MELATSTINILKALDLELKAMLQQDLNKFKAVKENNQQEGLKKQAA